MTMVSPEQYYEITRERQHGYKLALNAPGVKEMLTDLAGFCRAVRLATDSEEMSAMRMARLVGRQEVWERIQHHFNLTTDELYLLYRGIPFKAGDDDAA